VSVDWIWNRWHDLAPISSATATRIEVRIIINYIPLGTSDVAKAGSTIHSPGLLNLLVDSNFRCLWPRLLIAPLIISILYLRNRANSLQPESERAATHSLGSSLIKASCLGKTPFVTVDAIISLTLSYVWLTGVHSTLRTLGHSHQLLRRILGHLLWLLMVFPAKWLGSHFNFCVVINMVIDPFEIRLQRLLRFSLLSWGLLADNFPGISSTRSLLNKRVGWYCIVLAIYDLSTLFGNRSWPGFMRRHSTRSLLHIGK
jgi:hypothetical protein